MKEAYEYIDPESLVLNALLERAALNMEKVVEISAQISEDIEKSRRYHTLTKLNVILKEKLGYVERTDYYYIQEYFHRYSKCYYALDFQKPQFLPPPFTRGELPR